MVRRHVLRREKYQVSARYRYVQCSNNGKLVDIAKRDLCISMINKAARKPGFVGRVVLTNYSYELVDTNYMFLFRNSSGNPVPLFRKRSESVTLNTYLIGFWSITREEPQKKAHPQLRITAACVLLLNPIRMLFTEAYHAERTHIT